MLKDRAEDFVILVDPNWQLRVEAGQKDHGDYVRCSAPFSEGLDGEDGVTLTDIGGSPQNPDGEWVGLLGMSAAGSRKLREELERLDASGALDAADMAQLMKNLMARGETVGVIYVSGNWMNVNDLIDLAQARNAM
jgi:phosphoenolpyruvate phosphomutase